MGERLGQNGHSIAVGIVLLLENGDVSEIIASRKFTKKLNMYQNRPSDL